MAAVLVQISGMLYDLTGRTSQRVVLQGEASVMGLGVGGGPIIPPDSGGGDPPGIWGPTDPRPTPPIANVPGAPGYRPPGGGGQPPRPEHPIALPPPSIWPPGPGIDFPSHPIVIPPPVDPGTPIPPGTLIEWKTYWSPDTGWVVVGVPNVPHPTPS